MRPGRDAATPGAYRTAPVYDDDPLTSPSFPKIPASDSRSYGGVRPETPPSGSRILPPQAADATQHLASYRSPSGQFDGYDAAGRQHAEPASGFGPPGSLPADPGGLPPYRPAPAESGRHGGRAVPPGPSLGPPPSLPARPGGYEAGYLPSAGAARPAPPPVPGAPSGNPYGSYVSSPAASYQPRSAAELPGSGLPGSGLPVGYVGPAAADPLAQRGSPYPPAASGEHSATVGAPAGGWYPDQPAPTVPSASYLDTSRPLPPAENPGGAHRNGSAHPNGSGNGTGISNGHPQGAGYPPAQHEPPVRHEAASYLPPGYLPPGYPAGRQEPAGYAGYAGSDPYGRDPYGQDPYGGAPGYGAADS